MMPWPDGSRNAVIDFAFRNSTQYSCAWTPSVSSRTRVIASDCHQDTLHTPSVLIENSGGVIAQDSGFSWLFIPAF